jgi:UDP-galactopyranose mutase
MPLHILVVGAGFSGAVIARELAESGVRVTVIDKRDHVGGNAYDFTNAIGIRVHKYGPHLFHTSNYAVVNWLSRFTSWVPYKHKVKAQLRSGKLVTLPPNLETASIVGKDNIIDTFYRPYTLKMWGKPIEELSPEILTRVPIREDLNEFYFPNDPFQAMPSLGYTALFDNILDHRNINLKLKTNYSATGFLQYDHTFNSMPIDEYFDYKLGALPYRSIKFHTFDIPVPQIYPVATVNFTHDLRFTRATEWKNIPRHGDNEGYTTVTIEEPCDYLENNFERYYPIRDAGGANKLLYAKYRALTPENMTFIGRCGLYAYLDMHQAVSAALHTADDFLVSANLKTPPRNKAHDNFT